MRDLDPLLDSHVSDAAGRAAEQPDFAGLRARGRRRRARTRAVVAAGFVVVLAMGVTALQLAPTTDSAPPVDPPPATPSPTSTAELSAEQVVDDPGSRLSGLVVSEGDPDTRASVWSLCVDRSCDNRRYALALSDDGFATRTVLPRTWRDSPVVRSAGDDTFLVSRGRDWLLARTDGSLTGVDIDRAPDPVEEGEVVVPGEYGRAPYSAVDPATGVGHRLSTPEGVNQLLLTSEGQLRGIVQDFTARTAAVVWSDDGGATWARHDLPMTETSLFTLVPTPDDSTMAVVAGADGATLFPFIAVHRSMDGGAHLADLQPGRRPDAPTWVAAIVLPDGRLLVDVDAWSDQRAGRPGRNPTGLWVSQRRRLVGPGGGCHRRPLRRHAATEEPPPFELLAAVIDCGRGRPCTPSRRQGTAGSVEPTSPRTAVRPGRPSPCGDGVMQGKPLRAECPVSVAKPVPSNARLHHRAVLKDAVTAPYAGSIPVDTFLIVA